jgi:hypothetical protein
MTPETTSSGGTESLHAAVTGWAASAPQRRLEQLLIITLGLAAALLLLRLTFWPAAACSGTMATVAAWGLIDHRQQRHHTKGWRLAGRICVVVGTLLAIIAGIGAMFLLLRAGWSTATGG